MCINAFDPKMLHIKIAKDGSFESLLGGVK
jgi:hypothetical protein